MPNNETQPLFAAAAELGIGFHLGYAEMVIEDDGSKRYFNTAILVDRDGQISGKYRKVHIPGHAEPQPGQTHQHLEKRYFEPGDLGFPVFRSMDGVMGMCICNDRRWPETYRVMGLQGVELVMLGYNTPSTNPFAKGEEAPHLGMFHNHLSMQAGAIRTAPGWSPRPRRHGGRHSPHGRSCIIAPTGRDRGPSPDRGLRGGDRADRLGSGVYIRETIFNFAAHRRIEHYGLITSRTGASRRPRKSRPRPSSGLPQTVRTILPK